MIFYYDKRNEKCYLARVSSFFKKVRGTKKEATLHIELKPDEVIPKDGGNITPEKEEKTFSEKNYKPNQWNRRLADCLGKKRYGTNFRNPCYLINWLFV